jgi:hypothetical protein
MNTRAMSMLLGLIVYLGLALLLFGLHHLAVRDGSVDFPLWFSGSELVIKAAAAVAPGFIAGWFGRSGGLAAGAVVGAVGGVAEILLVGMLFGVRFGDVAAQIGVAAVASGGGRAS